MADRFKSGPVDVDENGITIAFREGNGWPTWIRVDNLEGPGDVTVVTIPDAGPQPATDLVVTAGEALEFDHGRWDGGTGFCGVVLICPPGDTARVRVEAR